MISSKWARLRLRAAALVAGVVLLPLLAGPGLSAQSLESIQSDCLQADTGGTWRKVAQAWAQHATEQGANEAARERLLSLRDSDQELRSIRGFADSVASAGFRERLSARDRADSAALTAMIEKYGWPGRTLVGAEASKVAFAIAQHGSLELQRTALREVRNLPPGEVDPQDPAYLEDRILVGEGNPQQFGTQVRMPRGDSAVVFYPIADPSHVDERRASVGLPPLAAYICLVRGATGKPVVDPRSAGVTSSR